MSGAACKATSYDEWVLKVLMLLSGPGNVFESGNVAMRDAKYDLLRECWIAEMTQYDAAAYYKYHLAEGVMKPREWFVLRQKKEEDREERRKAIMGEPKPEPCRMFSGMPKRMVKISTYRFVAIFAFIVGGLLGWFLRGVL